MFEFTVRAVLSILVIIAGIIDALKYIWERNKITSNKSSRDVSRKFVLAAILCDIVILAYTILIKDMPLIIIRAIALYAMADLYMAVYQYYPYDKRGLKNFKRPSLLKFTVNAAIPNRYRKHL